MLLSPKPMHIPDGFLSLPVSLLMWFVSILMIALALRKTREHLGEREIPLMGVLAAAIFAGQMLNFSVTGGTSGHLLGAAIATILMGPWAAVLIMTSVVSVQAIIFQDGGILALGANLFNMAIVGVFVSHAIFSLIKRIVHRERIGLFVGAGISAWASIFIASLSCALMLAFSGTSPANIAVPAMAAIHAIIGIGEAVITLGAVSFIYAARKDLLPIDTKKKDSSKGVLIGGGLITIILAVLSPLASSHPDGLEWVAEQKGFIKAAQESIYNIIPDYSMPGISSELLATITAGIIGVVIVFFIALGVAKTRKKVIS